MDIPSTLDTSKFRHLVLEGINAISGGTGSVPTNTNSAVGPDGVTRVPLQVNSAGELKVNVEASINADLTLIEGKIDTSNALLTTIQADLAAPLPLATGASTETLQTTGNTSLASINTKIPALNGDGGVPSHITNFPATQPVSGTFYQTTQPVSGTFYQTTQPVSGTFYQTTQPVSGTFYQTTQPVSVASIPSHPVTNAGTFAVQPSAGDLTSGSQKTLVVNGSNTLAVDSIGYVTANTSPATTFTFTNTGAVASAAVLIGPIDCTQFKELTLHSIAIGTGGNGFTIQSSNDSTNWLSVQVGAASSSIIFGTTAQSTGSIINYPSYGAKFMRVINGNAVTAGTTTCIAQFSQIPSTKAITNSVISGSVTSTPSQSSNGFNLYSTLVSAIGTNATFVKSGAGSIGTCVLTNTTLAIKYVKIFNKNSIPVVGTDTPIIQFPITPNSTLDVSMSYCGLRFTLGLGYAITGGAALLDTTSVAAGDVLVNITYF